MKASRFSDAQQAFILKQGMDGVPVADICRRAGISQATYFNWKKKDDGMLPPDMRRLKQLEDENGKLRSKDKARLDPCIAMVVETKLAAFAAGVEADKDAVAAAISTPCSNGQVEGKINRLKTIKRQMYARAKIDLLKARLMAPA